MSFAVRFNINMVAEKFRLRRAQEVPRSDEESKASNQSRGHESESLSSVWTWHRILGG